jgi:hypothetical protein
VLAGWLAAIGSAGVGAGGWGCLSAPHPASTNANAVASDACLDQYRLIFVRSLISLLPDDVATEYVIRTEPEKPKNLLKT